MSRRLVVCFIFFGALCLISGCKGGGTTPLRAQHETGLQATEVSIRVAVLAERYYAKHDKWPITYEEIYREFSDSSYALDYPSGKQLRMTPSNVQIEVIGTPGESCKYRVTYGSLKAMVRANAVKRPDEAKGEQTH